MRICSPNSPCQEPESVEKNFDADLLASLLGLPNKILTHHESMGLTPLVLHELGHDAAFKFKKASYLVNNPDFNCLRGFAGYCADDCQHHQKDMWSDVDGFTSAMQQAPFNQQVATYFDKGLSVDANGDLSEEELHRVCGTLGINNPSILTWKMRHGNHGILLFEADEGLQHARRRDLLQHFVPMLSLC